MEVQSEESISSCVRHSTSSNTVAVEVPEEIKLTDQETIRGLKHLAIGSALFSWWGMYQLPNGAPESSFDSEQESHTQDANNKCV